MTADAATQLADAKRIIFARGGCFRSLDSVRIEIEKGKTREPTAFATICTLNGTNRKPLERTTACDESSTTVACYLCNTLPKTGALAPLEAVHLLRVQGPSVIVMLRRRGASRGRPVIRWFA